MNQGQRFLGWGILLTCVLAIPVGLMSKSATESDDAKPPKKGLSWLSNRDRISVVRIDGVIKDDEGEPAFFGIDSALSARKKIRKAADDDHVKGLLIRINSPGGTVATSQEAYDAVRYFRSKGKPVVVSMSDVAASGGYYIASAADRVFALPGTLTGSIGVIMHLMNLQEIEKKVGIEPVVIKSGQFKDIGSSDRAMTQAEKDLLQSIIMDSYDQFVTAIADGRKMDKGTVKQLADGRIYSGRQALKVKLIDELGGYDDALANVQTLARTKFNLKKDLYVDDEKGLNAFASLLESGLKVPPPDSVLKGYIPESFQTRYLNQPLWLMQ